MSRPFHRPPGFFRPPSCGGREGWMPWGSPRHPFVRQYRPPFLRPPFGMTPEGLRLPSHMQAPPMFGPRGPTMPPHLMTEYNQGKSSRHNSGHDNINQGDSAKQFWCEPCDRGFNTKEMMNKHNSEHQKCGIDGCEFTAHGNVVTKHIQMQHRTGLYDKIRNINTPEDIENWVKERKKNYPTKENIEKKKAQQKECFDRGEKLQDDKGRFNNNRANNRDGKFKDRRNKFRDMKSRETNKQLYMNKGPNATPQDKTPNNSFDSNKKKSIVVQKKEFKDCLIQVKIIRTEEENYHNLKPFRGTSELVRNDLISNDKVIPVADDLDIADHEWQELGSGKANSTKRLSVCNALSNLISAYDSSDDEPDEVCLKIDNRNTVGNLGNDVLIIGKSSITSPSEVCTVSSGKCEDLISFKNSKTEVLSLQTTVHDQSPIVQDIDSDGSGPEEVRIDKDQKELKVLNNDELRDSSNINNSTNKRTRKRKHSGIVKDDSLVKKPNTSDVTFKDRITKVETSKEKNVPFNRQQHFKKRLPKTLLEKLLEKDIKNERNLVLQCIHFIVQNKFFNKTDEKECENSSNREDNTALL